MYTSVVLQLTNTITVASAADTSVYQRYQ